MVEDDQPLRALNRILLEETGLFEIVGEAEDGAQAIRLATVLKPDVILLDIAMPVLGGMEALPELRKRSPKSRIIILSMLQRDGIEQEALARGATGFIDKGLDSEVFVKRLRSMLKPRPRLST